MVAVGEGSSGLGCVGVGPQSKAIPLLMHVGWVPMIVVEKDAPLATGVIDMASFAASGTPGTMGLIVGETNVLILSELESNPIDKLG